MMSSVLALQPGSLIQPRKLFNHYFIYEKS
jgi:hypothetical protein